MSALHISLAAEPVINIGSFVITNSMLASVVASVFIVTLTLLVTRRVALQPKGLAVNILDAGGEALLAMIERVTNHHQRALTYFPFLATLFLFIIVNNWLGLLPGVGTIVINTPHGTMPLLRGATADLNTTFALAIISVILTQIYAIRHLGLLTHLGKYFSLNPILLFVGLLEFIAEFSKVLSFSFRLFGNIFAGEVLLVVISFLVPLVAPLPFFFLELFVGFIQALVFTTLTLVFLEIASASHGEHTVDVHSAPASASLVN
ncbi:MAG: hypothetical protein A3E37_01075 [Candidatus Andersenbacteria bacterium RIFCSPHIGHO2_12_FULL_46_9]|nr:MAG: ATP synthase subunit a [Parcubacteria group bacterium GW2011_GWA2_45_14]OGY34279.1 MAG: hypothetical protein A3B76_00550 [Candidatus Andersenbacteria bacterium RIFCSPHIGHO2_02_FULL_46_16]OGY36630.1 MAG: hypothetical protein A3I08_01220 [Candidatus Andersenbacteria bacterium RIFCSPLOWO2_02_FULL_46_11]OGY37743.1 MAG: hypothetical protein A3E37_01075 [Candidatus Andersenbacteria bacterium RIFCSPHIGHO2_12_FULL_46_9]